MTRRLVLGSTLLAAGTLALLAGCSAPEPDPTPVPTPSPTATAKPTPVPSPTPSPAPDAAAPEPTCDTVLTEAEYASLAEDGLTLDQAHGWLLGPAMEALPAEGALTCEWHRSGGDVSVWFAQLPEDEAAWALRRAGLEASGWTLSDDPIPGTLLASPDYDGNYQPSMLHSDGVTYFVSYGRFLSSVAALQ